MSIFHTKSFVIFFFEQRSLIMTVTFDKHFPIVHPGHIFGNQSDSQASVGSGVILWRLTGFSGLIPLSQISHTLPHAKHSIVWRSSWSVAAEVSIALIWTSNRSRMQIMSKRSLTVLWISYSKAPLRSHPRSGWNYTCLLQMKNTLTLYLTISISQHQEALALN